MSAPPDFSMFSKQEIRDTLNEIRNPFSVAVWGSENYFNAGSAIRTCHCFLAKELFLIDCPAAYERAAMGTEKYETIHKVTTIEFIKGILDSGRPIVAFERRAGLKTEYLTTFKWPENPILLFGSEKTGISPELLEISSHKVTIPLWGIQNDLNLGNAIAIGVFDFMSKYTIRK